MSFARDFLKKIKDDNTFLYEDAEGSGEFDGYIDTGCLILNALLSGSIYGGLPNNKIYALAGSQATGKSFIALGITKSFLDANPDAMVVYYDTEGALASNILNERDIDASRVIGSEPETVQQFRHHCLKVLNSYIEEKSTFPLLIVLDSLGMLSTTKEMEDSADGKETVDMTKAKLIKAAFRTITLKAAKAKVPVLVTNHTYQSMSLFPTAELSGGTGLKYSASGIIMLSKSKDKEGTAVVGNFIKAKMFKSRLTRENAEVEMKLSYKTGLDKYYGLVTIAEKYGIFNKVATRYEMPDGTKVFEKQIYNDPEKFFTKDILDKIDDACKREFCYGSGD